LEIPFLDKEISMEFSLARTNGTRGRAMRFTCSERVWGKRCGVIAHYQVEDRKFGKKYVCYHHCSTWLRDNKKRLSE